MTLMLNIPPELEARLHEQAQRAGISTADYVLQTLSRHLPPKDREAKLVALLQSWIDAPDADEQTETGNFLVRSLDEDRPSDRKLYPPGLEGITW